MTTKQSITVAAVFVFLIALCIVVVHFAGAIDGEIVLELSEGEAKAIMIKELTGLELAPEVAKWADVKFSGSTVSIDTHTINLWDGKKWRELER